jgi:hypothetical protein
MTELRVVGSLDEIGQERWHALLGAASRGLADATTAGGLVAATTAGGLAAATPFMRFAWLSALEKSGCAAPRSGWLPRHLTLWRKGELIAAAPAFAKDDSDGDFARDWDLASASSGARLRYYPKLALTVPFTPCTGQRILVAPGEDRQAAVEKIVRGAEALCKRESYATLQVLFPDEESARELDQTGLASRVSYQFHWRNEGYRTMDDFLARFNSKRRHMLKREMAAAEGQGIGIRTIRGEELARDPARWAKTAHALHRNTVDKLTWGRRWLNEKFYQLVFAAMPDAMEVVVAERDGEVVAGAFNVSSQTHLYGRYWGCFEEVPFLHFNVCYYHSIRDCIARGLSVFEGGAGGEHKLSRGFLPSLTYSAHSFLDARLDRGLREHLRAETPAREESILRFSRESPIFKARQEA